MRTPSFWHHVSVPGILLSPLALPYLLGVWVNRKLTAPEHATLPVISVGNITAGGAGKTPASIALAQLLTELGERPHLLTRGYGATHATPQQAMPDSDWRATGDEALLLARAAPCWVGRDRLASSALAAEHGASLVIADDALQHHRLAKDISFLVIDGAYGFGNCLPLPAGPLREQLATALPRVDAVIFIGDDAHHLLPRLAPLPVFHARLEPVGDTSFLKDGPWLAFAGLARPEKFFATLRALGATLAETASFADHHPYTAADIATLEARASTLGAKLIATGKDAVKLPLEVQDAVKILPVALQFSEQAALAEWLKHRLAAARA